MFQKDPLLQLRNFINLMEKRVHFLAYRHDLKNLDRSQGFAVLYLCDNIDKEVFVKDIEKKLNISKSVTSNLIKRMEKNGLIQVISSKEDRRYKRVILTELGKSKAKNVREFHEEMHQKIFAGVSREDLKLSFHVLERILKNLEDME